MPEIIVDPIVETQQVPLSPIIGAELSPVQDSVNNLQFSSTWNESSRNTISHLIGKSGIEIEWLKDQDTGEHTMVDKPIEVEQLLAAEVSEAQQITTEVYEYSNENLNNFKLEIVHGITEYAKTLGIDISGLEDLITHRIENIAEIKVDNPLAQGRSFSHLDGSAQLSSDGELRVNVDSNIRNAETLGITLEEVLRRNILHELLHGASFHAKSEDIDYEVRSGLGAMPTFGEGSPLRAWVGSKLLEEGAQEDIRWRHLDGASPSYEKSVMFWEAAIALDPSLEVDRFNAKFLNKDRGLLIGKLESIFGPNVVEILESEMSDYAALRDYPAWKDMVEGMVDIYDVDPEVRAEKTNAAKKTIRESLDKTQLEIYIPRKRGFSDRQLRETKATGVIPDEPEFKAA